MDNAIVFIVIVITSFVVLMVGATGYSIGQDALRNEYHACLELQAPQENCLKQMLGEK